MFSLMTTLSHYFLNVFDKNTRILVPIHCRMITRFFSYWYKLIDSLDSLSHMFLYISSESKNLKRKSLFEVYKKDILFYMEKGMKSPILLQISNTIVFTFYNKDREYCSSENIRLWSVFEINFFTIFSRNTNLYPNISIGIIFAKSCLILSLSF